MSFVDDFLHPENKCKRVGHALRKIQSRWIMTCVKYNEVVKPKIDFHYRCVAHQVEKTEVICQRCDVVVSTEWVELYPLHGISLPTELMVELRQKGMIKINS
ncbi:MAG: hypothetical protein WA052_04200 [Microgenomates group bacterium]